MIHAMWWLCFSYIDYDLQFNICGYKEYEMMSKLCLKSAIKLSVFIQIFDRFTAEYLNDKIKRLKQNYALYLPQILEWNLKLLSSM